MAWIEGLFVFILKEAGSKDSSGPNTTPNSNIWVIKGTLMKVVTICSCRVSKFLLINCVMQMKMCLFAHQKVVRQVWIFRQYSMKMTTKLWAYLFVPITQKNVHLAVCMVSDSSHCARCAAHFCQTCLTLERAYWDRGRFMPTLGQCSRVCELRWLVTRDRAFFTPLSYPLTDCIWRWGFMPIHFMAKSALSFYSAPHPQLTHVP
jgi:hypothetical protein